MINPSFSELEKISKSRYEICVMCMKRTRLLIDDSKPLVKTKTHKPVTKALEEIMAGKVIPCDEGELKLYIKKEKEEEEKAKKKKEQEEKEKAEAEKKEKDSEKESKEEKDKDKKEEKKKDQEKDK